MPAIFFPKFKKVHRALIQKHTLHNEMRPRGLLELGLLELEIKHKHDGFNINYEKATVVWQQFGFGL
jgi:hypothetical protein